MTIKDESAKQYQNLNGVIKIDQTHIQSHLDKVVRSTVEDTINSMLDAEADQLCKAVKYERSDERADRRAGYYNRKLHTKAGEVKLKVPRLRKMTFETAIIERYRRKEASVEEALIQMYIAGVSVRRVEDITEALWGTRVSAGTVSDLNKKIYAKIETWRNRKIEGNHPYVYLDGIYLKRSWGGEVKNVAILVAVGVDNDGYREILGICEGAKEDEQSWSEFLRHLKQRGLNLSSQGYLEKDLGRPKVDATAEFCRQINPDLQIEVVWDRFKRTTPVGNTVFVCVDSIVDRKHIFDAVNDKISFLTDGRMSAEVLRVITACDQKSREHYPNTLFTAEQTHAGPCTAKTTIYCANIAAGFMLAQFTKYLRLLPVYPDIQINLLASEINVGNC